MYFFYFLFKKKSLDITLIKTRNTWNIIWRDIFISMLELRMEYAKALLCNTNDKIKTVASRAGFNDYHYFSKAFKKMNGCSPVEYRKYPHNGKT